MEDDKANSLLRQSIKKGDVECCKQLLEQGAAQADNDHSKALFLAMKHEDETVALTLATLLLQQPNHPAQADHRDSYALMHAAGMAGEQERRASVQLLLGAQPPARADSDGGRAALVRGACEGHVDVCDMLLRSAHPPDLHATCQALVEAARSGHTNVCSRLLPPQAAAPPGSILDKALVVAIEGRYVAGARQGSYEDVCALLSSRMAPAAVEAAEQAVAASRTRRPGTRHTGASLCARMTSGHQREPSESESESSAGES
jgi:hypothetical protein